MKYPRQVKIFFSLLVIIISFLGIFLTSPSSKIINTSSRTGVNEDNSEIKFGKEVKGGSESIDSSEVGSPEAAKESDDSTQSLEAEVSSYRVTKVVDGDTLDVDIDGKIERVRLIGIDTPETVDPRKSVQCFGKEASNKSKEILLDNFVSLESDDTQGDRDKYKRLLRYIILADGTNFNLFMISEGFAHEYTYSTPYKYQSEFKQAEVDARNSQKGLWSPTTCSGNK